MLTQVTDEYGIHLCELRLDPSRLIGQSAFRFDQWDVDSGDRRVRYPPVWAEPWSCPPDWPTSLSFLTNEMLIQVTDEYGIHLCELTLDTIRLICQPAYHFWPMRCWLRWRTSMGSTCASWVWILAAWLASQLFVLTNEMSIQVTDEYGIPLCELSLDPIHLIGQTVFLLWPMRSWLRWLTSTGSISANWAWILAVSSHYASCLLFSSSSISMPTGPRYSLCPLFGSRLIVSEDPCFLLNLGLIQIPYIRFKVFMTKIRKI